MRDDIDALRGPEREGALGVDSRPLKNDDVGTRVAVALDEDTRVLRALGEAVRGVLGLDGTESEYESALVGPGH